MVFIIDLPLLKDPDLGRDLTPFGEELAFFLEAQGLEQSLIRSLKKYDFSETKELAFVHTMYVRPHLKFSPPCNFLLTLG